MSTLGYHFPEFATSAVTVPVSVRSGRGISADVSIRPGGS